MNCFYNPSQPAVGLCRHCFRALSREAATELRFGLACKQRCEGRARVLVQYTSYIAGRTYAQHIEAAVWMLFLAGLCFAPIVWPGAQGFAVAASLFLVWMCYTNLRAAAVYRRANKQPN